MPTMPYDRPELARALFEEAADALFLFDAETDELLNVNPVALRLTGFSHAELLRLPASYLFRFAGKGGLGRLQQASRETRIFHSQEGFLLRTARDGVWVSVNLSVSRLHLKPKTLTLITARDVRDLRDARSRLREKEAELERLMASVSACLWSAEVDSKGTRFRYYSPAVERITGRTVAFFRDGLTRWEELIHPEDRRAWRETLARLRPGDQVQNEYRIVRADGATRWVRESISAGQDNPSAPVRLDALLTDVTERREAEQALRASEQRYRSLFEENLAGVMLTTFEGEVLDCNDAHARLLGFAGREEVLAHRCLDFYFRPADREAFLGLVRARGALTNHEICFRRKDGSPVWALVNVRQLEDERGRTFLQTTAIDVTERKQLEEQFRQAQKIEAVGRLAGGIAHDFNNLLTVIQGYGDLLLLDLPPGGMAHQQALEIRKAAKRAAELTSQLLAFGRKAMTAPRVVDLNGVVREAESMLARLIGEDIELALDLSAAPVPVRADPGQLHQVIVNLVVNARDAIGWGRARERATPGRVTVRTATVTPSAELGTRRTERQNGSALGVAPGTYVELSVRDTGCGMTEEVQAHLFEPFFTTKEVGKGTGLGLPTVYGIVKQAGGHIFVESAPGRGSTFRILLPRVEKSGKSESEASDANQAAPQGRETVLLVEDEDAVRALAREVLRTAGYRVLEASCGEEAVGLPGERVAALDLLITDVVMPRMGGREVAERLTAQRPDLRVLYLSGYTDDAVLHQGVAVERTAFLSKPFTPGSLARKVREVLDA